MLDGTDSRYSSINCGAGVVCHLNGANSLPDSDLSLIDVSPWGNTGQGVARQVTLSALARERKRRCGLAVVILRHEQAMWNVKTAVQMLCTFHMLCPSTSQTNPQLASLLPDTAFLVFLEFF
jgi:hypothetical protein